MAEKFAETNMVYDTSIMSMYIYEIMQVYVKHDLDAESTQRIHWNINVVMVITISIKFRALVHNINNVSICHDIYG